MNALRPLGALPKAHLHLHLEGSYPLDSVQALAGEQGASFERPASLAGSDDFYVRYLSVIDLVRDRDDLARLCQALVRREAAEGVRYCEPNIEPQLFAPRLGSCRAVLETMLDAFAGGAAETGTEVGALVIVNTDHGVEAAQEPAQLAVQFAGRGVTAFGTAGFVEPAGLHRFAGWAAAAHDVGLRVVCHAGQTGGPESVRDALDHMAPDRIAHGVRAIADPALVAELAERRVVLDVAISSNVALGVVDSLAEHPVARLVAAGVAVTLNADDQLWFGSSITDEYGIARTAFAMDDETLAAIAVNGTIAAGMSRETRVRIVDGAAAWLATA